MANFTNWILDVPINFSYKNCFKDIQKTSKCFSSCCFNVFYLHPKQPMFSKAHVR